MPDFQSSLSPQDCLVAVMIALSASDENVRTTQLLTIERIVNHLPVFTDYEQDRIAMVAEMVFDLFSDEDGLDTLFELIRASLPPQLNETAYALACDVAAADGSLGEAEIRFLEEIRWELSVSRLHAAAIERAARARHLTVSAESD